MRGQDSITVPVTTRSRKHRLFDWYSALDVQGKRALPPVRRAILRSIATRMDTNGDGARCSLEWVATSSGYGLTAVKTHIRAAIEDGWLSRRCTGWGQGWRSLEYRAEFPALGQLSLDFSQDTERDVVSDDRDQVCVDADAGDRKAPVGAQLQLPSASTRVVRENPKVGRLATEGESPRVSGDDPSMIPSGVGSSNSRRAVREGETQVRSVGELSTTKERKQKTPDQISRQQDESAARRAFNLFQIELGRGAATCTARLNVRREVKAAAIVRAWGGGSHINRHTPSYEIPKLWGKWIETWRSSGPEGPPAPAEKCSRAPPAWTSTDHDDEAAPTQSLLALYRETRANQGRREHGT